MTTALTFNSVTLTPVLNQGSLWIRAAELARALGYDNEKSVSNIYARHKDEFSNDMSVVINLMTTGIPAMTRIFSLRGCHLLAMFARTPVTKAFRKWVLDVLDRLEKERQTVTDRNQLPGGRCTDREMLPFDRLVNEWSRRSGVSRLELLAAIRRQFSLRRANRIPRAILPAVMDYVRQASGLSAPESDRAKTFRGLMKEVRDLAQKVGATMQSVRFAANPGGRSLGLPPELEARWNAIHQMHSLAVAGLYQAEHTLYCMYYLGEGVDFSR